MLSSNNLVHNSYMEAMVITLHKIKCFYYNKLKRAADDIRSIFVSLTVLLECLTFLLEGIDLFDACK